MRDVARSLVESMAAGGSLPRETPRVLCDALAAGLIAAVPAAERESRRLSR